MPPIQRGRRRYRSGINLKVATNTTAFFRALHLKQHADRRYIFPEGEENLEKEWYDSNIAKLKALLDGIPVLLEAANFSDGQKMMMLDHQNPNSIHLAIKDAVDQKADGLYNFIIGLLDAN